MALNTDWKEFLNLLVSYDVEFLIVGAWALAHYGEPRMTGDIDLWVATSPENAEKVVQVIDKFGFGSLGLTLEDFVHPDQVIQLGYPPRRIDVLTNISGLKFDEAWPSRVSGSLDGIPVYYISKEHFILNKKASGRNKDLADVDTLEQS